MIGRTLERERKYSNSTQPANIEPAIAIRSTIQDARGSIQLGYENDSGSEKQDRETEKHWNDQSPAVANMIRRQMSVENLTNRNNVVQQQQSGLNDENEIIHNVQTIYSSPEDGEDVRKKKVHSATGSGNQTTWQQQSANLQQSENNGRSLFQILILFVRWDGFLLISISKTFQITMMRIGRILMRPNCQRFE